MPSRDPMAERRPVSFQALRLALSRTVGPFVPDVSRLRKSPRTIPDSPSPAGASQPTSDLRGCRARMPAFQRATRSATIARAAGFRPWRPHSLQPIGRYGDPGPRFVRSMMGTPLSSVAAKGLTRRLRRDFPCAAEERAQEPRYFGPWLALTGQALVGRR